MIKAKIANKIQNTKKQNIIQSKNTKFNKIKSNYNEKNYIELHCNSLHIKIDNDIKNFLYIYIYIENLVYIKRNY